MTTTVSRPAPPVAEMQTEGFWRERFPELSIGGYFSAEKPGAGRLDARAFALIDQRVRRDGYFQEDDELLAAMTPRLAHMVVRCVELSIPPPFLFLFDEAWACFYRLDLTLKHLLGDNYKILPDYWVWHVDHAKEEVGWQPHRDKGRVSLRSDGAPLSLTVWIPLTESMPLNGCLYILPAGRDPNYNTSNENSYQVDLLSVRALPAKPGEWLCWNQAVLHWGSQSSRFAPHPRVSMALEFQRGDIQPFNQPLLTPCANHPFQFRLKLVAKQILQYQHMYALAPELQAFAQRILAS